MLLGLVLKPFFILINFFIGLLGGFVGDIPFINHGFDVVVDLIGYGVYFMGYSTFNLVISTIAFWLTLDMAWACIEWLYKKIPGVD